MKTWKNKIHKIVAVLLAICLVTSCMEITNAQAATGKSKTTYYYTRLLRQKGGKKSGANGYYYDTGTLKITCKGNTLTMYSSFNKCNNGIYNASKKGFIKYGKHTFKLTSKTKYLTYEFDETDDAFVIRHSKSNFINNIKRLNGLGLWITIRNGKVVEMSLHS